MEEYVASQSGVTNHWTTNNAGNQRWVVAGDTLSNTEFCQQTWTADANVHDRQSSYNNLRDTLVNSAVDQELAAAIFRVISATKPIRSLPMERLEVRPSGGCDFSEHCSDLVLIGRLSCNILSVRGWSNASIQV